MILAATCNATTVIAMCRTALCALICVVSDRKHAVSCVTSQRNACSSSLMSGNPLGMYLKSLLDRRVTKPQSVEGDLKGCGRSSATEPNWFRVVVLLMEGFSTISFPLLRIFVLLPSISRFTM